MKKSNKFRHIIMVVLTLFLVMSMTACGNNHNQENDTNHTNNTDTLNIGVSGSISTLDINQEAGILNYYISALVGEGLVGINNNGQITAGLAQRWYTDDYITWSFIVGDNSMFSDGSPVTIDDIIWSIERAMDPLQSPGVALHFPADIQAITKVSDTQLDIVLSEPTPGFIWAVSNVAGLSVTSKAWAEHADSIGSPQDLLLGSGPFQVIEFSPGSHVILEAQDYWRESDSRSEQGNIRRIRFDFITDDATRLLAFTQGSIDFALNIPIEQSEQWEAVDGAQVDFYADRSYYGLTLDVTHPPFDNEYVRQAVAYSVNAAGIVNSVLRGNATVATAITPPEQFASAIDIEEARTLLADVTHFTYNLERAQKAFDQSGVATFETTIYYPDSFPSVGQASLVIADSLTQIGIITNVVEIPIDQWLAEIGSNQGIAWMILFATTAQPQDMVTWLLSAAGPGSNPANFADEEIARLMANVVTEPAEAGIDDLIKAHDLAQAQAIYVPVWWGQAASAWNRNIAVSDFNSYTLLSQNWVQHFTLQ
ncbi:MAG: ABC transporter substrate-binding protein [Lachnospiraceae bacterium]|nr:ABC transporter substrate-binding protein [Lachnospiraceae bacterium]